MVQRQLAFVLSILFAAFPALSDVVTTPKRLFGLGDATVVAASPDLHYIATAGQGGAFLWNAIDGTLLHRLDVEWWATALAFSPTTNLLAVATRQRVLLFETDTGKQVREFLGHDGEIYRLQFSADGDRLISAGADNTARVWLISTGLTDRQVRTPGSPIGDVSISRDGQKLATVDTFLTNCVKI